MSKKESPIRAAWWTSERRQEGIRQLQRAQAEAATSSRRSPYPQVSELIARDLQRAHRLEQQLGIIAANPDIPGVTQPPVNETE